MDSPTTAISAALTADCGKHLDREPLKGALGARLHLLDSVGHYTAANLRAEAMCPMSATPNPRLIFHIGDFHDWVEAKANGEYRMSTRGHKLADVGFIHASTAEQVESVANAVFRGARSAAFPSGIGP